MLSNILACFIASKVYHPRSHAWFNFEIRIILCSSIDVKIARIFWSSEYVSNKCFSYNETHTHNKSSVCQACVTPRLLLLLLYYLTRCHWHFLRTVLQCVTIQLTANVRKSRNKKETHIYIQFTHWDPKISNWFDLHVSCSKMVETLNAKYCNLLYHVKCDYGILLLCDIKHLSAK